MKITGNTVGTTMPRSDWNQTDPSKADYIKNKPTLGAISTKDTIEKTDLSSDVQTTLDKAETAATQIGNKVDKVDGKGLSTNDYTTDEKNKLSGVELGANNYSLPTATTDVLGGIKVGNGLTVDENGLLSVDKVTEETVSGEYTDTDRLDFRREISGTPMYIEIHSNADPSVTYGQSYWIKSGFIFFGENGEVDTEKSYYYVCEDGMNFGYNSAVTSDAIALSASGSISTLYQSGVMGGFLPDTGENPVSYTIRLVYGGSSSSGTADTTLGITGAAVGQIARITAVDSDGKPTAWEPVDMASGGGGGEDPVIVYDTVLTEEVGLVEITEDKNGNPFNLKSFAVICVAVGTSSNNQNGYGNMYINGDKFISSQDNFTRQEGSARTNLTLSIYNKYFRITSFHYRDVNEIVNEDGYLNNNIGNSMLYVNNNAIYRILGFSNEQSNIANSFKIKCEQNTVFGVGSRIIIYDLG